MVSVYDVKPRFQALLRPLCRGVAVMGVTANQVTVLAVVLSITTGLTLHLLASRNRILLLLPAALLVRMALNAMDGILAREFNMRSNLGAILNELGDVVSDTALYLPLAHWFGFPLMSLLVALAIISEMAGVAAVQIGASRRYDGPMGKSDRALVLGGLGLLLGCGVQEGWWLTMVLLLIIALLAWTIVNRATQALREVRA